MFSALPSSAKALKEEFRSYSWGRQILQEAPAAKQILPSPGDLLSQLGGAFTTAFGVLANVVIILFVGLFVAIAPRRYLHGVVRFFPPGRRERITEVFDEAGEVLSWWLIGRLSAMTLVGY